MARPWADQPFPLVASPTNVEGVRATRISGQFQGGFADLYGLWKISKSTVDIATAMALLHNTLIRNLNSIYLQAEGVKTPTDIDDFIIFCQSWYESVHHHHNTEERWFFPDIVKYTGQEDIMEKNLQQHQTFEAGVNLFGDYVHNTASDKYDAKTLKGLIDGFGTSLTTHLTEEIGTLLGLEKYGAEKLQKAFDDLQGKIMSSMENKDRMMPSTLGGNDHTFEGSKHHWPPFPFFVPYLVYYYYARRYRGSWRFSPCTIFGEPRPLQFVADS